MLEGVPDQRAAQNEPMESPRVAHTISGKDGVLDEVENPPRSLVRELASDMGTRRWCPDADLTARVNPCWTEKK
jgi:hypothetical protein